MKKFLSTIIKFTRTADIEILTFLSVLIPGLLLFIWALVAPKIFGGAIPFSYTSFVIAGCLILASLGGFIQIIRKEAPGVMGIPFRGIVPIIFGILWVVSCLMLSFFIVYFTISG